MAVKRRCVYCDEEFEPEADEWFCCHACFQKHRNEQLKRMSMTMK